VFTEEKLDNINARLEHFSQKSLGYLAQETKVSKLSAQTTMELLKLKPLKQQ
jgi:hypothetical protein